MILFNDNFDNKDNWGNATLRSPFSALHNGWGLFMLLMFFLFNN